MTCKLCAKHKKSNVMTGNICRNWKARTLKRHAHSADHKQSVVAKAMPLSFSVSNVFNEKRKSHSAILCALNFKYPNLPMSEVQLTKSVSIRNPLTLLIDLNQIIDNKWLLNSLHHLKISWVFYNDITKKTCMIPDARSKHLHFPSINARDCNDYTCDSYTYLKALDII